MLAPRLVTGRHYQPAPFRTTTGSARRPNPTGLPVLSFDASRRMKGQQMLIINAGQVRQTLPMPAAVAAMKRAFLAISSGDAAMPLRSRLEVAGGRGTTLVMPGHVVTGEADSLAVKIVSIIGDNPRRGLPRIVATVLAIDPKTGEPVAVIEGTTVTAIRTAAASGAATDALARSDSRTLAVIGAGVQAREHIAAIHCVRDIRETLVVGRDRARCERMVADMASADPPIGEITVCESADEAVARADIVCTVTTSADPVFSAGAVRPGTHINAVGSYQPHVVEIPADTVKAARVFVDHRDSALEEAGDLIVPIRSGLIDEGHILGEVGEVLAGGLVGRRGAADISLFKSVGCAAEDCLAAGEVLERARALGIGEEFKLT
jgi:ornithine cyclodeaminase/alanine dehydrogenase-like protein (mu-crystallin family)